MDLFLYILALVITIMTIGNVENFSNKAIKVNFAIAITLVAMTFLLTCALTRKNIDEMHDVTTYANITFAKPKTITVTTIVYPAWSIRNSDTEWYVKDQE
jgi:hypothetical protein